MNYINVVERYHQYHNAIHELMASIVTGIMDSTLFDDEKNLVTAMEGMHQNYPFVELVFTLDRDGKQTSQNISQRLSNETITKQPGMGVNRRHRPYYKLACVQDNVVVTDPYLSMSSHKLCISAAIRCQNEQGEALGILVVDIDLTDAIEFLMGDRKRKKYHPFFATVYSTISIGLFIVVSILLFLGGREIYSLVQHAGTDNYHLKPFGIIIYLTLALAIFDLGKTILEEEVLMHKDIFRHSSTRRTITRFIAAILIAVSIESLLLMFKSVLGTAEQLHNAVAMMAAAVGLLVGLGIYVYLGAKAEAILLQRGGINSQR